MSSRRAPLCFWPKISVLGPVDRCFICLSCFGLFLAILLKLPNLWSMFDTPLQTDQNLNIGISDEMGLMCTKTRNTVEWPWYTSELSNFVSRSYSTFEGRDKNFYLGIIEKKWSKLEVDTVRHIFFKTQLALCLFWGVAEILCWFQRNYWDAFCLKGWRSSMHVRIE